MPMLVNVFVIYVAIILGSTIPVLAYRLPVYLQLVTVDEKLKPQIFSRYSHCPLCHSSIKWYHKMPVLGIFLTRFVCSTCKEKIPLKYLLIECLYPLLALYLLEKYGLGLNFLFMMVFSYLAILLSVIDYELFLLPDLLLFVLLITGVLYIFCLHPEQLSLSLIGAASGFLVFYIIYAIYRFYFKKIALGYGDVKLMFVLGFWNGFLSVPFIFMCSALLLSVFVMLIKLFKGKSVSLLSYKMPYGPFLLLASFVALNFPAVCELCRV